MQQTGAKSIGTALSQAGFASQSTTARSAQGRELATAKARPSTKYDELPIERVQELKTLIAGPVMSMTPILQASPAEQKAMWVFWIEALAPYSADAIRRAFVEATKRRDFFNPKLVVSILEAERAEDLKRAARIQREQQEIEAARLEAEREVVSPERKAEIMREVFGDG